MRAATLTRASHSRGAAAFLGLVIAELRLILKAAPAWWYLGLLGLWIASSLVPMAALHSIVLPIASFWPVFGWSALGTREKQHATEPLFFSVAAPVRRMLPAAWFAGFVLMLGASGPGLLRLGLAGEAAALGGWCLGGAAVAALALALGVWSGSGRFFEVLYLFLWYVGPMHQVPELDYTGVTAVRSPELWVAHAVAAVLLFVVAVVGRSRQIQR